MLAYASGLRLSELCHLRVSDIDSAPDRMCIRVEPMQGCCGQGHKAVAVDLGISSLHAGTLGIDVGHAHGEPFTEARAQAVHVKEEHALRSGCGWWQTGPGPAEP